MAMLMQGTLFQGKPFPFVMELTQTTACRGAKKCRTLFCGIRQKRLPAAGVPPSFCCHDCDLVLQTFGTHLNVVEDSKDSILAVVSSRLAPVFRPLGFGDWRVSGRPSNRIYGKGECRLHTFRTVRHDLGSPDRNPDTGFPRLSLLVFCLPPTPCVAAVASSSRSLAADRAARVVFVSPPGGDFVVHGFALLFGM